MPKARSQKTQPRSWILLSGLAFIVLRWREGEKLCWYDCQPHPEDATLASTHPHHKHILPDLKNHRVPAPEMSFTRPNLPNLIAEVEALVSKQAT